MQQDFKRGFINEFAMKASQNGVESFQLENALGTATHAMLGWFIGKQVRNAVNKALATKGKPGLPLLLGFLKKSKGDKEFVTSKTTEVRQEPAAQNSGVQQGSSTQNNEGTISTESDQPQSGPRD